MFTARQWFRLAQVMCVFCAVAFVAAGVIAVVRWSFLRRALPAKATIVELIKSSDDDRHDLFAPVYVFTNAQGEPIKIVSSTASFPPPGQVGDQINVLYDPLNPKHSIQNTFFDRWGLPTIMGSVNTLHFVIFASVAFFLRRHLKKKDTEGRATTPMHHLVPPKIH